MSEKSNKDRLMTKQEGAKMTLQEYLKNVKQRAEATGNLKYGYVKKEGYTDVIDEEGIQIAWEMSVAAAEFLVSARQDIPILLALVEQQALMLSYITDEANGKRECHQMARNCLNDIIRSIEGIQHE